MTNDDTQEITALLRRIADALEKPAIPIDKQLWDVRGVATYLNVSTDTVMRYSGLPGFPKPARMPSPKGLGTLRWPAQEIMRWVERQR